MEDVPHHQIIVHGNMGPYLMDKEKWHKLTISTATEVEFDGESLEKLSQISQIHEDSQVIRSGQKDAISNQAISKPKQLIVISDKDDAGDVGVITQESKIMDTQDFEDMESFPAEDITDVIEQQTWVSSFRKKSKKKTGGRVTIATRASSRVPKDGRSMLEKATQRAQIKNDTSKGVAWAIWKNRNKMAIEKRFPSTDAVIHTAVNFLQTWVELQRENDKAKMKAMAQSLSDWMLQKNQLDGPFSDVAII